VALNFPFSIFGAVVSGFQRYDANTVIAMGVSVAAAVVNVAVLTAGYGLVVLVAATTAVRIVAFLLYSRNAYRIYPDLRIRPSLVRRRRLHEVTGFSVYSLIIDWANKLNYQCDTLVIGAFLGSSAVAVWAVAGRVITETQRLTNQLNGVLFPLIVDSDASNRRARLQRILLEGTRVSLAMVLPISVSLVVLAEPLVRAWVGEDVIGSVPVIQVLAIAVAIRVGNATGNTLLKGSGEHRSLAWINMVTGVVNLALSVLFVRWWGLLGVALGTLIPTAASAVLVLYPAACRRAGLPLRAAAQHAIAPTVWPALVMFMGLIVLAELIPPGTLLAVMLHAAAGAALYVGLFAVAIGRRGRATYTAKARQLLGRPGLAPAA
jgi:O-antigen/teichoic acid export membrane protein